MKAKEIKWREPPKTLKYPYIKRCGFCKHYKAGFKFDAENARVCTIKTAVRLSIDEICESYEEAEQ